MSAVITPFEGTELFNTASFNNRIEQINTGFSYVSNPNLLDNWYFGNPVDQRGGMLQLVGTMLYSDAACTQALFPSTKTTSIIRVSDIAAHPSDNSTVYVKLADCVRGYTGNGYTIDRWKMEIDIGTVTVDSDGIILDGGANGITLNQQSGTALVEALRGKIVTQSVMYTVLQQTGAVGGFGTEVPGQYIARVLLPGAIGAKTVSSATITMPDNLHNFAWFYLPPGCKIKIHAVKVELGPTQTLAHQENGVWVLNEVPNYGEQLRRCQRHCRIIGGTLNEPICIAIRRESTMLEGCILFDCPMRTAPSVSITGTFSTIPEFLGIEFTSQDSISPEGVSLFFKQQNGAPFAGTAYLIYAPSDTRITFSADL